MTKRVLAMLLGAVMALSITACGGGNAAAPEITEMPSYDNLNEVLTGDYAITEDTIAVYCTDVLNGAGLGLVEADRDVVQEGDIVSLDAGLIYKGYHSDAARTHAIGEITKEAKELIKVTEESFFEGMKYAKEGNYLYEISGAIGRYAEAHGYGVVRDLCGHGIGTHLHESPEIPNYEMPRRGVKLRSGMTLAIEPMINMGTYAVDWLDDDWTVVTRDGSLSAHYENTILITDGEPVLLTLSNK